MTRADDTLSATPLVSGAPVIAQIRTLLWTAFLASILSSVLTVASKAGCSPGRDASGRMVDGNGTATDLEPVCTQMTLAPSPLVFLFFIGAVLWAIRRVLRRSPNDVDAIRTLRRTARTIVIVAAVAVVVAQVWFWVLPLYGIDGQRTYVFPFPFGSVDVVTTPMPTS
ncbi:hypothetical protein [Microbacterium aurantiacum]|uniref:hypothetical protein n=1 Tax=Microbacterium aurantiacum TaxID=162393 RepID=UPI0040363291